MLFYGWILVTLAFSTPVRAEQLNLADTLRYASKNSPAWIAAESAVSIAEMNRSNALAGFFPTLDFTSSHGLTGSSPSTRSTPWTSSIGLTLAETLYDNGATWTRYRIAKADEEIARLQFTETREKLAFDITQAFYEYSLRHHLQDAQKTQFNLLNKQFKLIELQYRQGLRTRKDYLRSKAEVQRTEISLRNSSRALDRAALSLRSLIGAEPASASVGFKVDAVDLNSLPKSAPEVPGSTGHRSAVVARLRAEQADRRADLAIRNYWPQIGVSASAGFAASSYLDTGTSFADATTRSWEVALTLNWNLWDWGIRRRNMNIASEEFRQVELGARRSVLELESELAQLGISLNQHRQTFDLSRELFQWESDSYSLLESEFRSGKLSYLDLQKGLSDLLAARIQMLTAYFQLKTELAKLQYHEGKLYDSLVTR